MGKWRGNFYRKKTVSDNDFDILCKIIWSEARGEDEKGKILVANVIQNRVKSKNFPSTIKDVVFQENQFEPTRNGSYQKAIVTEPIKIAANKAMSGEDHSQGALYFRTISGATANSWHELKLTKLFDHGCHRFYK